MDVLAFASWRHFSKENVSPPFPPLLIAVAVECSPPPIEFDSGLPRAARESFEQTDELFLAQPAANLSRLRHLDDGPLHLAALGWFSQHQGVH